MYKFIIICLCIAAIWFSYTEYKQYQYITYHSTVGESYTDYCNRTYQC